MRPPVGTRFPKGVSGNPNGRPRKKKAVADASSPTAFNLLFVEEMTRDVPQASGEPMSLVRRLVRQQGLEAAKIGGATIAPVLKQTKESLKALSEERYSLFEAAVKYKQQFDPIFLQYRRSGEKEPPDIVPHPDHVCIISSDVSINGPIDRKGRRLWKFIKHAIRNTVHEIERLKAELRNSPEDPQLQKALAFENKIRRALMRKVPKGWNWREQIWTRDSRLEDFLFLVSEMKGEEVPQDILWRLRRLEARRSAPSANVRPDAID